MKKSMLRLAGAAAALSVAAVGAVAAAKVAKKVLRAHAEAGKTPVDTFEAPEAAEQAEEVAPDYYAAVRTAYDGGPNANPVECTAPIAPRTADGKIDVTKLASPEDFCNWDELGCQS